jgi:hypothetical protein
VEWEALRDIGAVSGVRGEGEEVPCCECCSIILMCCSCCRSKVASLNGAGGDQDVAARVPSIDMMEGGTESLEVSDQNLLNARET